MKPITDLYSKIPSKLQVPFFLSLIWFGGALVLALYYVFSKKPDDAVQCLTSAAILWGVVVGIAYAIQYSNQQKEKQTLAIQHQQMLAARPQQAVSQEIQSLPDFTVAQWWGGPTNDGGVGIALDEHRLKLAFVHYSRMTDQITTRIFEGKDILEATVEEHGYVHSQTTSQSTTQSQTKTATGSMVGRAIVGRVLFGPTGAIIGGVTANKSGQSSTTGQESTTSVDVMTDITLKVLLNDIRNPIYVVNFLQQHVPKHTDVYRGAVETAGYWHQIINVLKLRANTIPNTPQ